MTESKKIKRKVIYEEDKADILAEKIKGLTWPQISTEPKCSDKHVRGCALHRTYIVMT